MGRGYRGTVSVPGDCLSNPLVLAYSRWRGHGCKVVRMCLQPRPSFHRSQRTHRALPERSLAASRHHRHSWLRDLTQLSFLKYRGQLHPRGRQVHTQAGAHTWTHCLAPHHSQCLMATLLPMSKQSLLPPLWGHLAPPGVPQATCSADSRQAPGLRHTHTHTAPVLCRGGLLGFVPDGKPVPPCGDMVTKTGR